MSLFPTYITENILLESDNKVEIPREYEINFKTGQLTGRIVEKKEAIKTWIWLALHTPRYRFFIYSWNYGNDFEELIGKVHTEEYIKSEIQRMTEECLLINKNIQSISNFTASLKKDHLTVSFIANTIYGSVSFENVHVARP